MHTFDLSLEHVTKVEGAANVNVKVKDGKVESVRYEIAEFKRFYTRGIEGKPLMAIPQLLARICGTCSNAHLLCAIEACEHALDLQPTPQTMLLRELTMCGLNIRDHALHLYLFVLPDIVGKDALLEFDENDPVQHQMLHDAFDIKAAGNFLAELVAGRSVHAVYPTLGGFLKFPDKAGVEKAIKLLESVRPAVLRTVEIFEKAPFHLDRKTNYMALVPKDHFGFIDGEIHDSFGHVVPESGFRDHLEHVVLPYSQASAYKHEGKSYMVGSLARLNLAKDLLHAKTKESLKETLKLFPSTDIFYNNLAQAIEILHCLDRAVDVLKTVEFKAEPLVRMPNKAGVGIGVVEAPRGTLYHRVETDEKGNVVRGEVIVPTNQNQVNIEEDVWKLIQDNLDKMSQEEMIHEMEKLVRAYDPCMSCAAHFLKLKWEE
ncbi:MAG: Ni/Fe hydrogenase subunit alpha [Patescibacteria group bacterium]|jgi:coenzyme F420-reducing hydrogenase alpha subunit